VRLGFTALEVELDEAVLPFPTLECSQVKIATALPHPRCFLAGSEAFPRYFFQDSQLNVYAGEREVRPPAAPPSPALERQGAAALYGEKLWTL
jgi:hypothetical protein